MSSRTVSMLTIVAAMCLFACSTQKRPRHKKESTAILIIPGDPINGAVLDTQSIAYEGKNRGGIMDFIDPTAYASTGVSLLATGIKKVIDKEQKKYQAAYSHQIGGNTAHRIKDDSLYFYNQSSSSGPFDLTGMQFRSFSFGRILEDKANHNKELAMKAVFEVDTSNLCEILYDGIFRLKLKELELNYVKAKMPRGRKKINLDIEIQFTTSYISKDGLFYRDVVLGTFTKNLPGIVVGDSTSFEKFDNQPMDGWSFVVPRSYVRLDNKAKKDNWNKGAYCINVTVKETSRPRYVNKIAAQGAETVIDVTAGKALSFKTLLTPKTGSGSGGSTTKGSGKK